jgi:phosphatidylserine decarboxylase
MRNFSVLVQYILPHHFLSRIMHRLTRWRAGPLSQWAIGFLVKKYGVDLRLAQRENIRDYHSVNDFFTRAIKPEKRPIGTGLVSPVDAVVSQWGKIQQGQIIQAKGHDYSVAALLGDVALAKAFHHGYFCTLYLSPKDYHRIHLPLGGDLIQTLYIAGRLFSVNQTTAQQVPNLFARNERVVCVFETQYGLLAVVMVGAIFVGSIETVWHGEITPAKRGYAMRCWHNREANLTTGMEIGRFNMGSTVVLVSSFPLQWLNLTEGRAVVMGQTLAGLA